MGDEKQSGDREAADPPKGKPANIAPDAVKDPNEKTEGKPGLGGGGASREDEADPGSG
ncbi:hypothetical protein J2X36_004779 [Methylobacterium sp. BE186]|uniref:hypothetical protein n=1 Tax=Methylobacterium sp. BE186 TaxID=2817715 RepID=UPI002865FFB2|nr:hypothetical protein [Methylobacterium sp. BE186]MDR7039999.1 hypothetical protein [Methylobacterium sp. BE186]